MSDDINNNGGDDQNLNNNEVHQNDKFNQWYNTSDTGTNSNKNSYQNNSYQPQNNNKRRGDIGKKLAKVFGLIAAGLIIALGGGLVGSVFTQKYLSQNKITASAGNDSSSSSYTAPQFTSATDGTLTVSQAFEKVKPAVVTISTTSIASGNYGDTSQQVEGLGSGFIINEDGYILTNYHVISGSQQVTVLLSTGEEASAKVINYDQEKDIAVIKLADGTKVPGVAELGDSDSLYPGEDVIAIGTPLSKEFAQTLTKGVISAVNRNIQASTGVTMNVIQTDTAINPGNSGGPLVNTQGQVIGINSMKLVESTVEGIGFAIPINTAKDRIDALSKPILSLGVTISEIDSAKSKQSGYPVGLYVYSVQSGSVAETAGIQVGDVITKFDGKDVTTATTLNDAKGTKNAGDTVEVIVSRNGKEVKLQLTLK